MGKFCYAEIFVFLNEENKIENINPKYFQVIKDHSYECSKLYNIKIDNNNLILNWENFKNKCINYLDKEENIIKEVCLNQFEKIYNDNKNKYDFEYDFNKAKKIFIN